MDKNTNTFEYKLSKSPLAESVLNWYEFDPEKSVLLIGEKSAGLKAFFERRCAEVRTLGADAADARYDYAVCLEDIEQEEAPEQAITRWLSYLKPEGTLIFTCDNRFGLRYFCGTPEKYTELPYLGINGYPDADAERAGRCYSRAELIAALAKAGGLRYKFYYPVPDARMPQMIFTDNAKNGSSAMERLCDYDYEDPRMLGLEHRIFGEMIDAGALPFAANTFLVEVTRDGALSDIDFAIVTTDRGEKRGMATTVKSTGYVYKRPLYQAGEAQLLLLQSNTKTLAQRGVPVVESSVEHDRFGLYMKMPFIAAEQLSTKLDELIETDQKCFFELFDKIFEYTKKACMPGEAGTRVFLDLAPCNCFYVSEDEPLLFYDQEFVSEKTSVEHAVYRTIKYYFASSRRARKVMDAETLYERYNISGEMRKELDAAENDFIKEVRNTDAYDWVFAASTPDPARMNEKIKGLKEARKPYRVGYVPGVFDLFHTGHLRLLERCKERCECLIVGVLTDELVEYYKGRRPVVDVENRMAVIRGLKAADRVIPVDFSNTDKLDAWEQLHYDCHFSGDDHVGHWNDVLEELKKRGSNMEFFPYTQGISTTSLREKSGE